MEIYKVRAGDTLRRIAQFFGVSIQSIIDTNGLRQPENLVIGMELVIPKSLFVYTIQPGDTLWRISNRYGVNINDVININNLTPPYYLYIGQSLTIPVRGLVHTIRYGDTLWNISQRYSVPIQELVTINNLNPPYTIYVGQVLNIPFDTVNTGEKRTIETLGYFSPDYLENPNVIFDTLGDYLTYLGLVDFPITENGEVLGSISESFLEAARAKNVMVLPVLTNLLRGEFNSDLARAVLSNTETLNNLLNNIINLLDRYNLGGINIDIENVYPEDRELFTNFIRLLYERLQPNNRLLVINMAPKWEDWFERPWAGFFDYEALEPYIDRAAIMTYEWGWREGPPRPTAPIEYIERSLNYALETGMPTDKIILGLTLYGYDWALPDTPENLATTVTLPEVWDRARTFGSSINFDIDSKQPYLDYIRDNIYHRVWFENALSHYLKYRLIERYDLRGAFYWIINQPFQSTWYMVPRLFDIVKFE